MFINNYYAYEMLNNDKNKHKYLVGSNIMLIFAPC